MHMAAGHVGEKNSISGRFDIRWASFPEGLWALQRKGFCVSNVWAYVLGGQKG